MGCTKFDGEDKAAKIQLVFRYLDPGGEGSVSREEWAVLGQLWNEFDQSIREFVQFLLRTFEDLEEAWNELDDDESGELDEDEWLKAVEDLGYFGPAKVVFALLDNDDGGSIS